MPKRMPADLTTAGAHRRRLDLPLEFALLPVWRARAVREQKSDSPPGSAVITTGSTPQRPVLRGQMGNSSEFTRVVRYQSQAEAASMRPNEQTVGADHRVLLLQVGADLCVIESCLIGGNLALQHRQERRPVQLHRAAFSATSQLRIKAPPS
jgi:hypothetical protein